MDWLHQLGMAGLMALGMAWKTAWSLILGFLISAILQTLVSPDTMRARLGRDGAGPLAIATLGGAASSSCSYASAAIMRTLFKKGATLTNALAFLFASTNLVIELGVILYLLLGWEFMVAEWAGGIVLILLMSLIVRLTAPKSLIEAGRSHEETGKGHEHHSMTAQGEGWRARLANPRTRILIAQNFAMEWSMLWKDILAGFIIGGLIAAFVPDSFWHALFLGDAPSWLQLPANAVIGPLVAMLTFVCSVGNIPLAAVLWSGGASFGGVLAFIYADLIILPLLDAYRRYFGLRMAAYIGIVLFAAMAGAAIIVDLGFTALDLVPTVSGTIRSELTQFRIDYSFWLNLVFGALALVLWRMNARHPMMHDHHEGHEDHDGHEGHHHHSA